MYNLEGHQNTDNVQLATAPAQDWALNKSDINPRQLIYIQK